MSKIKLIICDDHRVMLDGIRALLSGSNDMEVVADALNGEELVSQVQAHQPDVVLTDIQMPVMDGIEATRRIVALHPHVKVVALSMLDEGHSIRKMIEAGVSGYLLKTADKNELTDAIRKVASGEKYFSAEVTAELVSDLSPRNNKPVDTLTRREKEIVTLIAQGLTDKEIADKIFLSAQTIITHRKNILSKLGLKNKVEIARFAMENGLI